MPSNAAVVAHRSRALCSPVANSMTEVALGSRAAESCMASFHAPLTNGSAIRADVGFHSTRVANRVVAVAVVVETTRSGTTTLMRVAAAAETSLMPVVVEATTLRVVVVATADATLRVVVLALLGSPTLRVVAPVPPQVVGAAGATTLRVVALLVAPSRELYPPPELRLRLPLPGE